MSNVGTVGHRRASVSAWTTTTQDATPWGSACPHAKTNASPSEEEEDPGGAGSQNSEIPEVRGLVLGAGARVGCRGLACHTSSTPREEEEDQYSWQAISRLGVGLGVDEGRCRGRDDGLDDGRVADDGRGRRICSVMRWGVAPRVVRGVAPLPGGRPAVRRRRRRIRWWRGPSDSWSRGPDDGVEVRRLLREVGVQARVRAPESLRAEGRDGGSAVDRPDVVGDAVDEAAARAAADAEAPAQARADGDAQDEVDEHDGGHERLRRDEARKAAAIQFGGTLR
mmetsp:Transcript_21764/g.86424  ORF Transcript_21764/g.86424 Transcript_21764/m.86424 type:complete len:281 (+) Transcript_21764:69-911(+)